MKWRYTRVLFRVFADNFPGIVCRTVVETEIRESSTGLIEYTLYRAAYGSLRVICLCEENGFHLFINHISNFKTIA
jgi:hypothetical protein